ncbi:MAG: hypothetical protein ACPGYV_00105 [Phycisphaeraceae bacterium]
MSEWTGPAQLGESMASRRAKWLAIAVIVFATVIGGGLRLHDLGGGGVWFDELYTIRDVSPENTGYSPTRWLGYQPTKWLLAAQGVEPSAIPGERYDLYQSLGITTQKARLASCLIGLFMIPLFGWAAWRPLGPAVAAMLAVLVALCVWNVSWSQVARFYTQVGLFGGLAILFYLDAIKTGCRWRFAASTVLVVLAYLTHPPAITIGGALALDGLVQLIRRRPTGYRVWGWSWALASMAVCIAILIYERVNEKRGYDTFVGGQAMQSHSVPDIVVYLFIMLTPVLAFAALVGLVAGRRHRAVWVLGYAALIPVVVIAAVSVSGGFSHYRYTYVSMIGWLGLAAVGVWYLSVALRDRVGPMLAWSPAALLVVGMMPQLGSYLTTGNRFVEPFHLAWAAVGERIEPGDAVFSERTEIAEYYLQRDDVLDLPGALDLIDEQAAGRRAWLVRLSASSTGRRHWPLSSADRMQLIDRGVNAVWLPYREVSVYLLSPPEPEMQEDFEEARP